MFRSTTEAENECSSYMARVASRQAQTAYSYERTILLKSALESITRVIFPRSLLCLQGSTVSGFGTRRSDADFALILCETSQPSLNPNRSIRRARQVVSCLTTTELKRLETEVILRALGRIISALPFIRYTDVIYARVPILVCEDIKGSPFEILINEQTGLKNTLLMNMYSRLDTRVPKLVILAKTWLKAQMMGLPFQGYLGSYGLTCMVVNYLQVIDKPILPPVVELPPNAFDLMNSSDSGAALKEAQYFWTNNRMSLACLFKGFLHYYAYFNYSLVISVRLGKVLHRYSHEFAPMLELSYNKPIMIEEPFSRMNCASYVTCSGLTELVKAFREGDECMSGWKWQGLL